MEMAEPDFALVDRRISRELDCRTGSGHGGGGVDRRVSKLESDVKEIKADLKAVGKDVAELKGRAAAMPTMWQLLIMVLAISASLPDRFMSIWADWTGSRHRLPGRKFAWIVSMPSWMP